MVESGDTSLDGCDFFLRSAHAALSHITDSDLETADNLSGMGADVNDLGLGNDNGGRDSSDGRSQSSLFLNKTRDNVSDLGNLLSDSGSLNNRGLRKAGLESSNLSSLDINLLDDVSNLGNKFLNNLSNNTGGCLGLDGGEKLLSDMANSLLDMDDMLLNVTNDLSEFSDLSGVDNLNLGLRNDLLLESSNSLLSLDLLLEKMNNGLTEMVDQLLLDNGSFSWLSKRSGDGSGLLLGNTMNGILVNLSLLSEVGDSSLDDTDLLDDDRSLGRGGLSLLDDQSLNNSIQLLDLVTDNGNLSSNLSDNSLLLWDKLSGSGRSSRALDDVQSSSNLNNLSVKMLDLGLQNGNLSGDNNLSGLGSGQKLLSKMGNLSLNHGYT